MSIEAFVKEWLSGGEDRHLRVKHGGEGGLFYVLREDADDNDAERDDRRAERRAKEIDTDHLRKLLNQAEDLLIEATEGEDFNGCPAPDEAIEPYLQVVRAIESRKVML